jgi:hypothetical protein
MQTLILTICVIGLGISFQLNLIYMKLKELVDNEQND